MFARFLLLVIAILLSSFSALSGQTGRPPIRPSESKPPDKYPGEEQDGSRLPEDMRIRMAIARAEEDHKKVLEVVEKLSDLSDEVVRGYTERKQLSSDDLKKLGAIEKLAKRILEHAGGEEVGSKSNSTENLLVPQALDMLGTTVANIKKEMSAETRYVVSATVIANSNQVINLTRLIKRSKKTN